MNFQSALKVTISHAAMLARVPMSPQMLIGLFGWLKRERERAISAEQNVLRLRESIKQDGMRVAP